MRKIVIGIIGFLFIIFALFGYSWYRVHISLSWPHIPSKETPATYNLQYETRSFTSGTGKKLEGWYVPTENAKAVVIIVHGYLNVKGIMAKHSDYLHDAGYATFVIDLSSDLPNEKTTLGVQEYKDVIAAYDYIHALPENKGKKIGIFGVSMGASSSIVAMGKTGKGDFLIAAVPYANFDSLFKTRMKLEGLPEQILPFIQASNALELGVDYASFAPDNYIRSINKPILLISAENDTRVNANDANELFVQANEPKYYWQAKGSDHDIYSEQPEAFEKQLLEFLAIIN